MLSQPCGSRCLGICKSKAVAFLVDDKKNISLLDELVVTNWHVADVTRHVWRDCNDLGAHACISRPRRVEIVLNHVVAEESRGKENHECKQDTKGGVHRISHFLQSALKINPPTQNKHTNMPKRARGACQNSRKKPILVSSRSTRTKTAKEQTNHTAIAGTKAPSRSISVNIASVLHERPSSQQIGSEHLASDDHFIDCIDLVACACAARHSQRTST